MANYPNHCFIFVGSTQARHCCCHPAPRCRHPASRCRHSPSLATPTATTLTTRSSPLCCSHHPLLVTQAVESVHGALPYFRKAEPAWLQLPGYTPSELAAMSHQLLTAAGYSLPVVPARDATSLLQQAICATWAATHRTYELLPRSTSGRGRPHASLPRYCTGGRAT